jgi:site-specific recombinase XerD
MGQLYVKMATDLKLRRYSPRTQKSYLWAARRFVRHFMRAPGEMGSAEIRQFLLMLHERGESASSIKMYVASLHFLYAVTLERPAEVENIPWPRVAQKLPAVVSRDKVEALLGAIERSRSSGARHLIKVCVNPRHRIWPRKRTGAGYDCRTKVPVGLVYRDDGFVSELR